MAAICWISSPRRKKARITVTYAVLMIFVCVPKSIMYLVCHKSLVRQPRPLHDFVQLDLHNCPKVVPSPPDRSSRRDLSRIPRRSGILSRRDSPVASVAPFGPRHSSRQLGLLSPGPVEEGTPRREGSLRTILLRISSSFRAKI